MKKRISGSVRARVLAAALVAVVMAVALLAGCGTKKENGDSTTTKVGPEKVTAYEAVQYCKPAADKWEEQNWMILTRSGDPDGMDREGKSRIWEIYFFSPRPEENNQLLIFYNRGNVWPNTPGNNKGGETGLKIYRENKPPDFRVDSSEAYTVALRNGGGEYLDAHPDAKVQAALRSKADYDAVGGKMPAPKYKWIWDVYYRVPGTPEILHVYVDGMNGDFITKETQQPSS